MTKLIDAILSLMVTLLVVTAVLAAGGQAEAKGGTDKECKDQQLTGSEGGKNVDLVVTGQCEVLAGKHTFDEVNILDKGKLIFTDAKIDFWASSILVENGGSLVAGTPSAPIGTNPGAVVTIHLSGAAQGTGGTGVRCKSTSADETTPGERCGVPLDIWNSNVDAHGHPGDPSKAKRVSELPSGSTYPGPTDDYFYAYHPLLHDEGDPKAYFGYKVLGVSYGGTLELYGKKGACTKDCGLPSTTGQSWVRLNKTVSPNDAGTTTTLVVDSPVDWKKFDQIVVTTTDYLPGHSELLTVAADTNNGTTVTVDEKVKHHHNGARYPIPSEAVSKLALGSFVSQGAETRAAVALLSRSIKIVSAGAPLDDDFPPRDVV